MRRTLGILLCSGLWLLAAVAPADAQDLADRLRREVERTTEVLERIAPRVKEANHPRASLLIDKAVELQTKAVAGLQAAEDAQVPAVARARAQEVLALTLRARDMAQQAARILQEAVGLQERASRRIEQASTLWERLHDATSDAPGPRVRTILQESRRQIESAKRHHADHQFEIALRLAESAIDLLTPLRDGPGVGAGDRIEGQLERAREWLERANDNDSLSDADRQRLERARELWQRARRAWQDGNPELAERLLRQLQDQIREVRGAAGPIAADDVQRAVDRFDAEAARLRDVLDDHGNEPTEAVRLLERAVDERGAAVDAAADGRYEEALRRLRGALDMLSRARRLLGAR